MDEKTTQDELALVRRARTGDKEAFGQLMEMHAVRVYRIAYSITRDQSEAEDAVQEAFVTAFKSIRKLEKEESFRSWLSRIVTTRVYDLLRKKQKGLKAIEKEQKEFKVKLAQSTSNPADSKHELSMDLQDAISNLPQSHRLAVMLRYTEDASTDEIATILDRPAGTVRRILSESYQMLRLYLQEGDESS
ncbi:MAG: RNA polymerase sigma factor [Dehalococcoidia bacterium]